MCRRLWQFCCLGFCSDRAYVHGSLLVMCPFRYNGNKLFLEMYCPFFSCYYCWLCRMLELTVLFRLLYERHLLHVSCSNVKLPPGTDYIHTSMLYSSRSSRWMKLLWNRTRGLLPALWSVQLLLCNHRKRFASIQGVRIVTSVRLFDDP